ncbi:hypothetical protein W97_01708 [Coniosporium apollinis CBS 100218]|uniref:Inner kinetochore subunit AME1 domain-containing protein n=1 Tax=Coniosporium apollinis (strain CBS 100218) TaxID=1168221 RepID=R7YLH9_CONA1|nr:uncharacterized protein W97_01708 [Coniosporium apollinis CBS 100218]EON62486.1 hypothetical protein W97_01708 [Coniosporium apollinis CBS 100218]
MAPPDREARRQIRQRGAGNRNLANANFGFTFGAPPAAAAPLQPRASARRTPARLTQQPSSRRTPKTLAPRASARKTPVRSEKMGNTPGKMKTPSRLETYFPQGTARRPGRSSSASAVALGSAVQGSSGKLRAIRTPGRPGQQTVATPSVTGKRKRGGALDAVVEAEQELDELGGGSVEGRTPVRRRTGEGVARASTARRRAVQVRNDEREDLDELGGGDEEHMLSSGKRGTEMRAGSVLLRPLLPAQGEPDELESPLISSRRLAREPQAAHNNADGEPAVQNGPGVSEVIDTTNVPRKRGRGRPRKAVFAVEDVERLEAEPDAVSNGVVEDSSRISAKTPARRTFGSEERQEADAESADELTPAESRRKGRAVRGAPKSQTPASMDVADAQSSDDLSPDKPVFSAGRRKSLHERQSQHESGREGESDDELSPEKSEQTAAQRQTTSRPSRDRAQQQRSRLEYSPVEKDRLKATKKTSTEKSLFVGAKPSSDDIESETPPAPSQSRHDSIPPRPANTASTITKPLKRRADAISKPSQPAKRRRSSAAATVPITAYRLSKPSTLEPSVNYPAPRIPILNAIDVLAQVTSEISARLSDNLALQSQRQPSSDARARALLRRKRATVRTFSAHLSDALFGLTEALDAGAALQSRLRAARKEKVALREELLDVRRRRQEVLVRMDQVRAGHARAQKEEGEREALSEGLFDIEVAVQRGRESAGAKGRGEEGPEEGVEGVVRGLVEAGISAKGEGGMLVRVRAVNAFLERAAAVLEGRA